MTTTVSPERRRQLRNVLDRVWGELPAADPRDLVTGALSLPFPGGPVLLGRDSSALPHLLVPVQAPQRVSVRLAGVSLDARTLLQDERAQSFLDLSCRRTGLVRVFLSLAVDVCSALAAEPHNPVRTLTTIVDEWRALLAPGQATWSRSQCAGLFGELIVLLRLLQESPAAAAVWTGPSGAAQDFRAVTHALEVKTTLGAEGRLVTIHGWDQLEAPVNGNLHLAWFRVEESTSAAARSVRELLLEARAACADPLALDAQLAALNLPLPPDPEVDERRFVLVEERWFLVNETFPKIVPRSFIAGAVPAGVADLHYRIDLDTVPLIGVSPDPRVVIAELGAVQ